jgi:osmotically-inducible protein OsmY
VLPIPNIQWGDAVLSHQSKERSMHKPDTLLEFDVRDSLDWDRALDDRRIAVNAEDGHVVLTGSVPSYYDKVRAEEDALTVGGVKTLDNKLLIGAAGAALDDAHIAEACRTALRHNRFVPEGSVTATIRNGRATLLGQVRNPFQRQAAEHAVSRIDGVLGIENLIAISPEPIPTDVAQRIKQAFARSALVDGSKVRVTNDGHTVYLTGSVRSYAAMREAVDTAAGAPGVERVINDMVIEP